MELIFPNLIQICLHELDIIKLFAWVKNIQFSDNRDHVGEEMIEYFAFGVFGVWMVRKMRKLIQLMIKSAI